MKTKKIIGVILSIIISLINCSRSSEEGDTYEVISLICNKIVRKKMIFHAFPVKPPKSNINLDSLKKILKLDRLVKKDTTEIINALIRKNGRYIVAIDTILTPPYFQDTDYLKIKNISHKIGKFSNLYDKFKKLKENKNIVVSKIVPNEYSYIIPYRGYHAKLRSRGYDKFNVFLKFSRIAFNVDNNKAIVMLGASFGKLNSFGVLYFLEKREGKWHIAFEKGLYIS